MTTVTRVRENAGDILADARQINEDRTADEELVEDESTEEAPVEETAAEE